MRERSLTRRRRRAWDSLARLLVAAVAALGRRRRAALALAPLLLGETLAEAPPSSGGGGGARPLLLELGRQPLGELQRLAVARSMVATPGGVVPARAWAAQTRLSFAYSPACV